MNHTHLRIIQPTTVWSLRVTIASNRDNRGVDRHVWRVGLHYLATINSVNLLDSARIQS
jgi:hypothetical protein